MSEITLIFLIDNSSSLFGIKLAKLDNAFSEIIEEIQDFDKVKLNVAALLMTGDTSSICKWVIKEPISVNELHLEPIKAHGHTPLIESLQSVDLWIATNKMSPNKTILLLMTDGEFGYVDWSSIDKTIHSGCLERCVRIVCLVGSAADDELVECISSGNEYIIRDGEQAPGRIKSVIEKMISSDCDACRNKS